MYNTCVVYVYVGKSLDEVNAGTLRKIDSSADYALVDSGLGTGASSHASTPVMGHSSMQQQYSTISGLHTTASFHHHHPTVTSSSNGGREYMAVEDGHSSGGHRSVELIQSSSHRIRDNII